ncbi:MAG: tRNA 4-thiouridine(8) synthase ThiI [Oscillospiraceae bacterium]|nr:tRNA 4-thiouridine(8) synthase ThiI [Oscillospiraceae bacterium]
MKELVLLKCGELTLKGLNRGAFEDALMKNARRRLKDVGKFKFYKAQSTIYAEPLEDCDLDEAVARLSKVFGFSALSRAAVAVKDFDAIKELSAEYLKDSLSLAKTFKVAAKRSDKTFTPASPEICAELGHFLLQKFPHLAVDVHSPEVTVIVEIRDYAAYIHREQTPGAGGLPVGMSGSAALLLSGGIDSPVAGYMMAKRGLSLIAVHFASPPYTSERAELKVKALCEKMSPYCGRIKLFTVQFSEIQQRIKELCPEDYFTIIMRRYMMEIASKIAAENHCGALVTGESVAQVASQTLMALACTDAAASLPVLRPVIGMDKEEIITIARKIDTFDTSILPYDDCCMVFTPRRPKTKPRLHEVIKAESALSHDDLIHHAIHGAVSVVIG